MVNIFPIESDLAWCRQGPGAFAHLMGDRRSCQRRQTATFDPRVCGICPLTSNPRSFDVFASCSGVKASKPSLTCKAALLLLLTPNGPRHVGHHSVRSTSSKPRQTGHARTHTATDADKTSQTALTGSAFLSNFVWKGPVYMELILVGTGERNALRLWTAKK